MPRVDKLMTVEYGHNEDSECRTDSDGMVWRTSLKSLLAFMWSVFMSLSMYVYCFETRFQPVATTETIYIAVTAIKKT